MCPDASRVYHPRGGVHGVSTGAERLNVDEKTIGDAFKAAAKKANLEKYEVRVLPRPKNFIEVLMSEVKGTDEDDQPIHLGIGNGQVGQSSFLWKAVLPVLQQLEPRQTESLRRVLTQLARIFHPFIVNRPSATAQVPVKVGD